MFSALLFTFFRNRCFSPLFLGAPAPHPVMPARDSAIAFLGIEKDHVSCGALAVAVLMVRLSCSVSGGRNTSAAAWAGASPALRTVSSSNAAAADSQKF